MSRVSHFQRFSLPENHATNNTLLLLRYFYQSSPFKIEGALTSLIDKTLSIGLSFQQQVRRDASIPDALILQEPMRIYVEAKRGGALDHDQVRRHLASIAQDMARQGNILIGITKEPISADDRKSLTDAAADQGVTFAAVTFSQIAEALRQQCAPHEGQLAAILDDYEDYLAGENLLEERDQRLVVFPCGTSIAENARFNLYYEPPSRPCKRNHRFIGVYNRKVVAYVGMIEAIAVVSFEGGEAEFSEETGQLTDDHKTRIKTAIDSTPYYDLKAAPHRYYLVDRFVSTDLRKISPGGIMGLRYLDLTEIIPSYDRRRTYSTDELAAALRDRTWK
jgi:hypothetical protein